MTYIWKWVSVFIFFAVGVWCVLGARRMQQAAIKASEDLKVNPFRSYIKSPTYLIAARVIGVSAMLIALLLGLGLMFAKQ